MSLNIYMQMCFSLLCYLIPSNSQPSTYSRSIIKVKAILQLLIGLGKLLRLDQIFIESQLPFFIYNHDVKSLSYKKKKRKQFLTLTM